MGLDNMRGSHGRCPPLLVACLLVMCVGLVFNWWSLSSQNFDLIKQLEELSDQLKISFDQQDACLRQKQVFGGRIKTKEDEFAKLNVKFDELQTEITKYKQTIKDKEEESKKSRDEVKESFDRCNVELESLKKLDITREGTLETLRLEKEELTSQLQEKNEEIKKLKKAEEKAKAHAELKKDAIKELPVAVPPAKTSSSTGKYQSADLPTVSKESVKLVFPSIIGMVMHPEDDILPHDPPIIKEPESRISVSGPTASSPVNNISEGGDHEQAKEQDENANLKDAHDEVPEVPVEVGPESNQVEPRMEQPPDDVGPD